jgi:hypothetical protein
MESAGRPLGRDRTAIATSIALHLCVLALLVVALPRSPFSADDPDERTLLTTIIRIQHPPVPVRHILSRPALAVRAELSHPAARPVIHTYAATGHATRALVVAREAPNAYASAQAVPVTATRESDPVATVVRADPQVQAAEASPVPTATPVATVAPVARSDEGIGNFGETYPASVEPTLRRTLAALGTGFDVRITVDEDGRATAIDFVRAPADATLLEAFRAKLLAARFIPAACNGLRCIGTVELKN